MLNINPHYVFDNNLDPNPVALSLAFPTNPSQRPNTTNANTKGYHQNRFVEPNPRRRAKPSAPYQADSPTSQTALPGIAANLLLPPELPPKPGVNLVTTLDPTSYGEL